MLNRECLLKSLFFTASIIASELRNQNGVLSSQTGGELVREASHIALPCTPLTENGTKWAGFLEFFALKKPSRSSPAAFLMFPAIVSRNFDRSAVMLALWLVLGTLAPAWSSYGGTGFVNIVLFFRHQNVGSFLISLQNWKVIIVQKENKRTSIVCMYRVNIGPSKSVDIFSDMAWTIQRDWIFFIYLVCHFSR